MTTEHIIPPNKLNGYPSLEFIRIRETILKKQKETLEDHQAAVTDEIIRCNNELRLLRELRDLLSQEPQDEVTR